MSSPIDVVWNEHKQVQLIDSLMHNYYMPPLVFCSSLSFSFILTTANPHYLAVISNEDDTETHVCIDGKQRLTAIQKCVVSVLRQTLTESYCLAFL
jgi:uncharacterized protein with ParB-like and HNH nuclease domain